MATYLELFDLRSNDPLRNRVAVATVIKAQSLIALTTPSNAQLIWAERTLRNPQEQARLLLEYLLAANKDATVAQITGATDVVIQNLVNTAADKLLTIT